MKILSIGTDRKLFEGESAVSLRIKEYATMVEEYHVIVFALRSLGLKEKQIAPNVWVYPTNSRSRFLYVRDASIIGKRLVLKRRFVRGDSLVTAQDPFESGWAGLNVKKRWRLPIEVQLHTDPFSPSFSGGLNFIRKVIMKKVLSQADSVRVVTGDLQEKVRTHTQAPVSVLPIYIDRQKIADAPIKFDIHTLYPWRFVILMVARLEREKNIPLALKVIKMVREKFPQAGLLIVGEGRMENELKTLVKKMGLSGAVEFAGEQKELVSYYKTANAFLQTSGFEGYGMALIEAGLSGLPVVTTPVGIALELDPEKDAYIYSGSIPEAFAEGLIDLIEDSQKRENLRINLRKTLESKLISKEEYLSKMKLSWEETAKRIR